MSPFFSIIIPILPFFNTSLFSLISIHANSSPYLVIWIITSSVAPPSSHTTYPHPYHPNGRALRPPLATLTFFGHCLLPASFSATTWCCLLLQFQTIFFFLVIPLSILYIGISFSLIYAWIWVNFFEFDAICCIHIFF